MSMERYLKIRREMESKMSGGAYHYFFRSIPDGDRSHCFVGPEKEVRKLAAKVAKQWGVLRWKLVPLPKWNHIYDGSPAYQDDTVCLDRISLENAERIRVANNTPKA